MPDEQFDPYDTREPYDAGEPDDAIDLQAELEAEMEAELVVTPKVPRFDEVVLGDPPQQEPMSLTERSMQTLSRQLENLNQRIAELASRGVACVGRHRRHGRPLLLPLFEPPLPDGTDVLFPLWSDVPVDGVPLLSRRHARVVLPEPHQLALSHPLLRPPLPVRLDASVHAGDVAVALAEPERHRRPIEACVHRYLGMVEVRTFVVNAPDQLAPRVG